MVQVSLFTGPDYLIENESTISAHAFLATDGIIPAGGLVVSVDAPSLSEFDLASISVEGGEIVAVRDGGFDLRMDEYTTLVNLPIADDGEVEIGETATFSLATGEGYDTVADFSGGTFELVDTRADIPQGVITEPNNIAIVATDTQITPENPSFVGRDSIYFDIGNRYLNDDGTFTYIDYFEDVDLYKLDLSAGNTVAVEIFEVEGNLPIGIAEGLAVFNADGDKLVATSVITPAAPDKLFGAGGSPISAFNEDGTVNLDETENYLEFTAPEDGIYYVGVSNLASSVVEYIGVNREYDINIPGSGGSNLGTFGNYDIEIDLLTPDNLRKTGTPTPPVSNPNVTNPPTFSLAATPNTVDSDGNLINGVVETVDPGSVSTVNFTIRAEGDIPDDGIEFVLNSNANLFDYVSFLGQERLPQTIGGQSLGAFYNAEGIPTGIRLRIDEPTMTVAFEAANRNERFIDLLGLNVTIDVYEALETDGPEDVTFFIQSGEGYEIAADGGTVDVTYYDSVADVPPSTGSGNAIPEVGVTISETQLIETEETETTLTFTLSEPPPAEGIIVAIDSDDDLLVGGPLGQFDVLNAQVAGGDFPIANADETGFFFNITEQTATITLSVFDELTTGLGPNVVQEGIVALTFELESQPNYTIDPNASEIVVTIADNPDSQILVSPAASGAILIESEGSVGTLSLNLGAPPPAAGITVSVSSDSFADFNVDAITATGGTIVAVGDDGFDVNLTEQNGTVSLPVLDDGVAEDNETITFTIEQGDTYETNPEAVDVSFNLADTIVQASAPAEIERNNILSQANEIGLSTENPTVSLDAALAGYSPFLFDSVFGYAADVDFYSVSLDAGQTVAIDIDGDIGFDPTAFSPFPIVLPALEEVLQTSDTELRLFDAQGNELAANSDGAAPGEEFSRDPYLEFTAETAGTYYIGVSQLGNRNYDPFVEGSGSGWTFPEVGVHISDYELIVTLELDLELKDIDFESSSQGDLSLGDVITDQFDDLTIEVAGDLSAMIFDSANPTGGDYDLRSDTLGNILIISEDGDSADPDDNAKGGTLMFDWDGTVSVDSLGLLDIEESGGMVTLYGADDTTVLATIDIPGLGDNSLQSLNIGTADVGKMDVLLAGSGAITEILLSDSETAI
ncbi:MAG: PPC domain-containing protein [Cyanobacteria bacterium P01_F01_bin.150]